MSGPRRSPMRLLLSTAALALAAGCSGTAPLGSQQGYAPEQPIAFSHAVHAGHYELDCQYCHTGAEKSRHAGVPPASVCMNCHSQVKTDSPEIQKLANAVFEGRPIEWVKVHRLPDHAYFNHSNHVTAGVKCQDCHGPVEQMVRVEQVQPMTMGWCLDCHRKTLADKPQAPTGAGTLLAAVRSASGSTTPAPERQLQPPTDCSACHR